MTPVALGLILLAAICHATWNLLVKRAAGGAAFIWLVQVGSVLVYAPAALLVFLRERPVIDAAGVLAIGASGIFHVCYFLSLQRGYREGDLSVVYPVARGTGPAIATAAAVLFLGERPSGIALAGAVLVVAGVLVTSGDPRKLVRADSLARAGVRWGLLTGVFIASYSLVDRYAVSVAVIPPLVYLWIGDAVRLFLLAPLALSRPEELKRQWRHNRRKALGVSVLAPLAYVLVLTALVFTPLSYVAPAREISILFGAVIGTRFLAEGDVARRLAGAACILVGIAALALG